MWFLFLGVWFGVQGTDSYILYDTVVGNVFGSHHCPSSLHPPGNLNETLGDVSDMELIVINDQGWSSASTFSLVRVGNHSVVWEVDDCVKRLVRSFPAFTHEDTIYVVLDDKIMELLKFVVYTTWINIHNCWKIKSLVDFVLIFVTVQSKH